MKPPYEKLTKWLEKAGEPFMAALEEELRQMVARTSERLEPSAALAVRQRLAFEACRTAVIKADTRLKSSKGGAKTAKTKKADADARWRTDARKEAQDYVDEAVKAGREPTRADVINAIRREFKRKGKEEALPSDDRVIGRLVDAMRQEGKIKLDQ